MLISELSMLHYSMFHYLHLNCYGDLDPSMTLIPVAEEVVEVRGDYHIANFVLHVHAEVGLGTPLVIQDLCGG